MISVDSRVSALVAVLALAASMTSGCKGKDDPPLVVPVDHPAPTPLAAPAAPDEPVVAPTLAREIELARPKMEDGATKASEGTEMLAAWSGLHLAWSDVDLKTPETTVARADADPNGERGKRLCESGTITEFKNDDLHGNKVAIGILSRNNVDLFQFIAVRNLGTLAEKSPARFCGVFTSHIERTIATGGTAHAVQVVGLFDLPDNKKPPSQGDAPHATTRVLRPVSTSRH